MRAALYCRVSTEEQAKFGFSINAQKEELTEYAKANNYSIVDIYSDEGVSGGKINRPELNRLLEDVKNDMIDIIIFIKLDRWFRSVAHYYKIEEILEEHKVCWKATQEDYETETSSGRFKVNIMLSVSQQFKDATSERIKFVNKSKIKNGGVLTGKIPFGYKISINEENRKIMAKDEECEHIINDIFEFFLNNHNIRKTLLFINEKYDKKYDIKKIRRVLTNEIYSGKYRDNNNYCKPYISKETYNEIQNILKTKIIVNRGHYSYLFVSLLICPCCGRKLTAHANNQYCKTYRCAKHWADGLCSFNKSINEKIVEAELITSIEKKLQEEYNKYIYNISNTKQVDKTKSIEKLNNEKNRITVSFNKGWISLEQAELEHSKIDKKIKELYNSSKKIISYELLNNNNWLDLYNSLNNENKRIFWRKYIDYIEIDKEKLSDKKDFLILHIK